MTNKVEASQSTWNAIHSGMRQVVTSGTVRNYFTDTKITFAGKSGTAQENLHRNSHALFVAYAPYDNPKIAISTVLPLPTHHMIQQNWQRTVYSIIMVNLLIKI